MINTLVMILAGGKGERLSPLTRVRAKPSVPFGGRYRIIDFALSNFINSGFFRIKVLHQTSIDEVGPFPCSRLDFLEVFLIKPNFSFLNYKERTSNSAVITIYLDFLDVVIIINVDL